MSRFITLYKFTGAVKGGGPERYKVFKSLVEAEGGAILHFCGVMGPYDVFTLCEYPDTRAAMKGAAAVGNLISARPLTLPCVDEPDFLQLLTELS